MVNVSRSNIYIVKGKGFLCTESEREGNTKKELSLKKCGKSVAESVAATKVWHTKCGRVAGGRYSALLLGLLLPLDIAAAGLVRGFRRAHHRERRCTNGFR